MKINFKYLFKNLTFNPHLIIKELFFDLKKDADSKKFNSTSKYIWICGLPKSGTTLIEEILENLPYVKMDRSIFRVFPNKNKIKLDNVEKYISCFPEQKYSYIKTHLEYSEEIINSLLSKNFKIIVTFRDIRDVMISRYFHILSEKDHWQHDILKDLSFEKGFIKSLTEKTDKFPAVKFQEPIIEYFNWIKKWKKIENKNILKVHYEDYNNNPHSFIKKILDFTSFREFDSIEIEKKLSQKRDYEKNLPLEQKLKRTSKNVSTFRSGKSNIWKKHFSEEINKKFNDLLPENIQQILN